jgi:PAS domain S-box-containing protein
MGVGGEVGVPESMFRRLFEAGPDAIVILDGGGRIVLVNQQTEKLFGYDRSELLGQTGDKLVPGGHFTDLRRGSGFEQALHGRRKDGSEFPIEISLSSISTEQGPLLSGAIRDITERSRRVGQQELDEEDRRIRQAHRLKSDFLANLSHELRTPLNAVIGFTALLHSGKAGSLSSAQTEYLGDILASSRHLLRLINDVLDLATIESGRITLRPESLELAAAVNDVRDLIRGLASEKRMQVGIEMDPALSSLHTDPRLLKQVLYSYLSNAIKFTPEHGRVDLRIATAGPHSFRIDVEDSGIGIKREDVPRLFVEFQQLDSGFAKRYPGTGLGLPLTKRIVEAQGGSVSVESQPGRGSTFTAILPRDLRSVASKKMS